MPVDFEKKDRRFESVFSHKVKAGRRRTYFFDVRQTKGNDYYITMTESTRRFEGEGYERHKIFLYKEDFNRFVKGLEETVNHIKTELMPDYDYDEYDRRHEEYLKRQEEEKLAEEQAAKNASSEEESPSTESEPTADSSDEASTEKTGNEGDQDDDDVDDEDLKW